MAAKAVAAGCRREAPVNPAAAVEEEPLVPAYWKSQFEIERIGPPVFALSFTHDATDQAMGRNLGAAHSFFAVELGLGNLSLRHAGLIDCTASFDESG